jgi:hypothetical protein
MRIANGRRVDTQGNALRMDKHRKKALFEKKVSL